MSDAGFTVNRGENLVSALIRISNEVPRWGAAALYAEAKIEQKESMARTPVLTGTLKGSHETEDPVISGRNITCRIVVGGPAESYAVYVHENLEAYHANGQAKFLESTLKESAPYMAQRLARRLNLVVP